MVVRSSATIAAAVLGIVLSWPTPAYTAPKTDVVTLRNADHFTGEILRLHRGRLELKTDDAGTIDIEWDKVIRVVATRQFEVTTSDGRQFLGALGPGPDGTIAIVTADAVVPFRIIEITGLVPVGANFWRRIDGSVDAGFTYTRSSGIATATLNLQTSYRRPAFYLQFTASATLTEGDDSETSDDRAAIEVSYVRYRGRRLYLSGALRLENNESLGVVLRSQVGGQIGLRVVNTNRAQLALGGGLVVNDEQPVDAPHRQNLEGLVAVSTSFYTYDRPKTNLDVTVEYYPSFSNWGRQRLQVDTRLKREMWRDFYVALDVYDTFDSAPPDPAAARNDVGIVVSVGWSY